MTDGTLEEIIAVEREIEARLADERQKAEVWLAGERDRITRDTEVELEVARRQCRQLIAAAEAGVDEEVVALARRAEAYAERLQSLPEERLRAVVSGHLPRLLPEKRR